MIADDSTLFRRGLASVLTEAGHDILAQCADGSSVLDEVAAQPPDVAILDIRMPPTGTTEGLVAAGQIRQGWPQVGVLVLSQFVETTHAVTLLTQSPQRVGYLLKDRVGEVSELTDALARIHAGGAVIDPEVVTVLIAHQQRTGRLDRLTDRERDVLRLMAQGRSNAAISREMFLSERTIETHIGAIFTKLDIVLGPDDNRRVLAVLAHLRDG